MFAWILTFCYCSLAQPLIMLSNMLFHFEIFEASVRLIKTNKITCPTYGWMISEEMMANLSVIPEDMHVFYWFYSKMEHNCCLRILWKILFDILWKRKTDSASSVWKVTDVHSNFEKTWFIDKFRLDISAWTNTVVCEDYVR